VIGTSISDYCDQHKLTIPERLRLFVSVCEGVQHAHYKSIVHRDLKPSNILVVEVDGRPVPKIIDFGIAKAIEGRLTAGTMASLTGVGTVVGTPHYMSPEQADSAGLDLDTRTDVYSLGVVLYELLVGVLPLDFSTTPLHQFANKLRDEDAPKPSTRARTLSGGSSVNAQNRSADGPTLTRQLRGDLDAITLKALEKDRNRRYSTPSELAADIERYLRNEPVLARPAGLAYRSRKYLRRHRVGVAVGAFTTLILLSAAVFQTLELQRTRRERDRADRVTEFMTRMFEVSNPSEARGNDIRVREILDKASLDIEKGLTKDPELQAQMQDVMGTVYMKLGLYRKADTLLRQAVEIRRRILGTNNAQTLKSMDTLGEILGSESLYPEAEKWLRETLDGRRRLLGAQHRDTLKAMSHLATLMNSEGHFSDAEKINREALETAKQVFGPEDLLVTDVSRNLAIDLAYEGKSTEAEKEFRQVLATGLRVHGAGHPRVIVDTNNLGAILQHMERYSEADKVYSEAIQSARKVLGPEHPDTLMLMGNLGQTLTHEQRYAEAAKLLREVFDVKRRTLGPENRSTLVTAGNLAEALRLTNQLREAEELTRQNLSIEQRVLGPRHSDTLTVAEILGDLLKSENRYSEAEKVDRQVFEGRREVLGPDHRDTASAAYKLACVLALEGKKEESLPNLQFAIEHPLSKLYRLEIEQKPDFKTLRGDPRFEAILASSRQRIAAQKPK
jgi:eukaryotic-like serine/threonine-protein kinase